LEFTTLLKSIQASHGTADAPHVSTELIQSEKAARAFVASFQTDATLAVQCLLSGGSGIHADVQGMAFSSGGKTAFISLDVHECLRTITGLLQDTTRTKAVHDLKAVLLAFHHIGLTLAGPYFDTMVADYLLNPNRRDHQLDTLALEMLGQRLGGHETRRRPRNHYSMWIPVRRRRQQPPPEPSPQSPRSCWTA
jgi:DNA polymerase-1